MLVNTTNLTNPETTSETLPPTLQPKSAEREKFSVEAWP